MKVLPTSRNPPPNSKPAITNWSAEAFSTGSWQGVGAPTTVEIPTRKTPGINFDRKSLAVGCLIATDRVGVSPGCRDSCLGRTNPWKCQTIQQNNSMTIKAAIMDPTYEEKFVYSEVHTLSKLVLL